jgi:hypothetical protein
MELYINFEDSFFVYWNCVFYMCMNAVYSRIDLF